MNARSLSAAVTLALLVALNARAADVAAGQDAKSALESLKKLAGEWEGHFMTPDGPAMAARYKVTGGGNVVEETLFPGTPQEMVSMYHLDGKDLVMTHYCASGNQPHLRLNPAQSSAAELSFGFVSGSNMDPAVDGHMHSGRILLKDESHVEGVWSGWQGGKPSGNSKRFILSRKKS
jgi:hypothetical protein